jgi:hypothetical protein
MGIMFQTLRPDRELDEKGLNLLQHWNKLSTETRENITKEVFGDSSKQPSTQIEDNLAKAILNASSDQT